MRTQLWACEPVFLENYLARIWNATPAEVEQARMWYGLKVKPAPAGAQAALFDDEDDDEDEIYEEIDDEAHIKINGVLSQDGPPWIAKLFGFQGTAYSNVIKSIAKAKANPHLKTLNVHINSPGGEMNGCNEVWQALADCPMKTMAINHGLMASAAYLIASACDEIRASAPNNETGSVGAYFAGLDESEAMKAEGLKKVKIVAADSPRKDSDIDSEEGRAELQLRADAQCRAFIDRVAQGRGFPYAQVKSTFGQGSVMVAIDPDATKPDAISIGMIDGLLPGVNAPVPIKIRPEAQADIDNVPARIPIKKPNTRASARSTIPAPAGQGEIMKLDQLLEANPEARAEYNAKIQAAEENGRHSLQAKIDAAKPFLELKATAGGYDAAEVSQISKAAIDVILGKDEPSGLKSFVRLVDMNVEKRKGTAAQAETVAQGDTPAAVSQDAAVLSEAIKVLGQKRVDQIKAYCESAKVDLAASLKAELDLAPAGRR